MKSKREHSPEQWRAKLDSMSALKRKKKNLAIAYKGGKCLHCAGVFHPAVYDFHHLDPKIKEERSAIFLNWRWDKVITELDKCVLLCSNCHRIEHYDQTKETTMNTFTNMNTPKRELTADELAALALKGTVFVTTDEGDEIEAKDIETAPTLH